MRGRRVAVHPFQLRRFLRIGDAVASRLSLALFSAALFSLVLLTGCVKAQTPIIEALPTSTSPSAPTASVGGPATIVPRPPTTALEANAEVRAVVDGDTIVVAFGDAEEHVRLIGIDTPETSRPDTPVECFGPESSAAAEALLPRGTPVRIERDTELRDRYDRLLSYVYRANDGLFVNLELVRTGFADAYPYKPNVTYSAEFRDAADAAKAAKAGLWGTCAGPHEPA